MTNAMPDPTNDPRKDPTNEPMKNRTNRYNHEYTPDQLMRFHLFNLVRNTSDLAATGAMNPAQRHLSAPAETALPPVNTDQYGNPTTFVPHEEYYRQCADTLTHARRITDQDQPSPARTMALQKINSATYSIISIIKLITLFPAAALANNSTRDSTGDSTGDSPWKQHPPQPPIP